MHLHMVCDRVQAFDVIFLLPFETQDTRVRAARKFRTRIIRSMLCILRYHFSGIE